MDQCGIVSTNPKNSPRVELYGLQGLPLTYFCDHHERVYIIHEVWLELTRSLVNQNLRTSRLLSRGRYLTCRCCRIHVSDIGSG